MKTEIITIKFPFINHKWTVYIKLVSESRSTEESTITEIPKVALPRFIDSFMHLSLLLQISLRIKHEYKYILDSKVYTGSINFIPS